MNIGFFFMHPPGESMGSLYRVQNFCQGLTMMSHHCFVFLPFNCFEDWGPLVKFITIPVYSSGGKLSKKIYKIIRKILDIEILSNTTILNPKVLDSILTRISNRLINIIYEKNIQLDVIIGETEIGGLILTKIKDKLHVPIIVDYQNYWPEELVENKIIKRNSRRYKFLVSLEKNVIKNGDLIITPSEKLRSFLAKKFTIGDTTKIKSIINGGVNVLEKPNKKEFPPKIINAGMVVQRSNIEFFFKAIPFVLQKYPETQIYVTRKGEKLKQIMKLAKKMNLNINFYWKETYSELLDFLSRCHVGVVTSTYELTRRLGFVTKIYDYFSVGLPVVGNDIGGWTSVIKEEKVGLLSSNDPKDLAEKIIHFIENPDIAYEYGQRAINLLKHKYNVKNTALKLIQYLEEIKY